MACNNISSWPDPIKGKVMELPFIGQLIQVTIPKYAKMAPKSNKTSNEQVKLERKDSSSKRASSTHPRDKEKETEEVKSAELKPENKPLENKEIDDKIQMQNHEILLNKKHKEHNKEKSEGRKGASQTNNNLSFLLRHGDNKEKGTFQDINLVKCFGGSKIGYLWKLWELVLTNQPLLIVSDSPTKCRFITYIFIIIKCFIFY